MTDESEDDPVCNDAMLAIIGEEGQLVAPIESCGVVRRGDYVAYSEARQMLIGVRERAQEILHKAEADAKAERERGYQEGLAAGRAEMFAMISRYKASMLAGIDARVEEFIALVASCAEQAIGAVLPEEFLSGLVGRAVRSFADAHRVELYAHSNSIRDLESVFSAKDRRAVDYSIRFFSDNDLGEDEFRLITGEFSISYSRPQLLDLIREALSSGALREQAGYKPGVSDE